MFAFTNKVCIIKNISIFGGFMNEEQIEQTEEIVPASFFERVVAFVIDLTVFNLIVFCVAFLGFKTGLIANDTILKIFTYSSYIVLLLYFVFFTKTGKTLGKFLVGIEVINKDEKTNLTLKQSIFRTLGYVLDLFTFFGGILLAFFNQKRRTLHDFLGSSIVISTRRKSPSEEMALSILGTVIIGAFVLLSYYILFRAPTPFDEQKIEQAKEQLEDLAYLEELHKDNFGYYTDDLRRLSLISGDGVQLNRDLQSAFKRRGFKIGLNADKTSYRIEGYAKDSKETLVFKEKDL